MLWLILQGQGGWAGVPTKEHTPGGQLQQRVSARRRLVFKSPFFLLLLLCGFDAAATVSVRAVLFVRRGVRPAPGLLMDADDRRLVSLDAFFGLKKVSNGPKTRLIVSATFILLCRAIDYR